MKEWRVYYRKNNYLFVIFKQRKELEELLSFKKTTRASIKNGKKNSLSKSKSRNLELSLTKK